jgi:lipid-A-disaccharide synthase
VRVLISAAEASSDAHGAELLKALKKELPPGVELDAFGIGGPHLQAAGLRTLVDARELLAMGSVEVLGRLPRILRALKTVANEAELKRPDVAIVIDYPDFHFRLARRLKQIGIPVLYYIPPKVWVWRKKRIQFLQKFFVRILCILPFEEEYYRSHGVSVKYVGNPLVDELPLEMSRSEARKKLEIPESELVWVLMPGSRPSELKRHLKPMLDSVLLTREQLLKQGKLPDHAKIHILLPFPPTADLAFLQIQVQEWMDRNPTAGMKVHVSQGNAAECLIAADAGLVKSGTSTLEAGVLQCPHIVLYRPNGITAWIFKYLIRYRGPVALVNLVAGWSPGRDYLVPEILCEKVTPALLAKEFEKIAVPSQEREQMLQGFSLLREKVCGKTTRMSPSLLAAQEVLQVVRETQTQGS